MDQLKRPSIAIGLLTLVMLMVIIGCSSNSPSQSTDTTAAIAPTETALLPPPPEARVQFVAEVAKIDLDLRELTFVDNDYVVIAAEDCQIVQVVTGEETAIELSEIQIGDRVKICGLLQDDGSVLANKICLYSGEEFCQYDLGFRDTIATIDYDNGSFTVFNRNETIWIGPSTIIWGIVTNWQQGTTQPDPKRNEAGSTQAGEASFEYHELVYEFTDLKPGYIVEIKANIIDENTLQAANIKLANQSLKQFTSFRGHLASVDPEGRLVTFSDYAWLGYVCKGAGLYDAEGNPISLADFVVPELVLVKGYPIGETGDSLKVCEMTKLE